MTFENAGWLIGLAFLPVLALLFVLGEGRARKRLEQFASARLLPQLVRRPSGAIRWFRFTLILLALAALMVALARPQMGFEERTVRTRGADVIFAIDTSRRMLANDLQPNRLIRSKLAVLDMLESLPGQRVGLVAFAGTAFLQCPLTLDQGAFRQALDALDGSIIPVSGTNLAAAIAEAQAALKVEGEGKKFLVLVTDGEDLEAAGLKQAREVEGITIITIGAATAEGGLVPADPANPDAGYTRSPGGELVISSLDPTTLEQISTATGGYYVPLRGDAIAQVQKTLREDAEAQEAEMRVPLDRFHWALAAALILLLLEPLIGSRSRSVRGGVAAMLALGLIAPDAEAMNARDAGQLLNDGRYDEAIATYDRLLETSPEDPRLLYNKGVALYKGGSNAEAAALFEQVAAQTDEDLGARAAFNHGNALLRQAKATDPNDVPQLKELLTKAKAAYEKSLSQRPDWDAARKGIETAAEALKELEKAEQQQEQEQQPDGGDSGEEQDGEQQQSPDESGGEEQQQGESGDSEQQQEQGQEGQQGESDDSQSEGGQQQESEDEGDQQSGSRPEGSEQGEGEETPQDAEATDGNPEEDADGAAESAESGDETQSAESGTAQMTDTAPEEILLTREQAEMLLRMMEQKEQVLPAGKLIDSAGGGQGRDW